jgi:HPr kinase/phosphorylase
MDSTQHGEPVPDKNEIGTEYRAITVHEFATDPSAALELEIIQPAGLDKVIRSPRIQKLGMALAGLAFNIHPDRIQLFGSSEHGYLKELKAEDLVAAIQRLRKHKICCIVVMKGLEIPEELVRFCKEEAIPVIRTVTSSSNFTAKIIRYLETKLAPRMTVHGVLIEIFGLGVLIMGPSGIGKSECALELILKGHRLISDDAVELTRRSLDRLLGSAGDVLKHHMELRGLGIINIKEVFGISATSIHQPVDFAVRLERWKSDAEYDRLGLDQSRVEFLGVAIPLIDMPVAPGRNLAALIEVAARIHLLRQRGYHPVKELS